MSRGKKRNTLKGAGYGLLFGGGIGIILGVAIGSTETETEFFLVAVL